MIKTSLFAALLSLSTFSYAQELPGNLCTGDWCSEQQKAIWAEFQAAGPLKAEALPSAYSGVCFHSKPYYDPTQEQHAIAVFDKWEDAVVYGGSFSFMATSNPYAGLSVADAKKQYLKYEAKYKLQLLATHAEADMNPGREPIWRYWMKQSASGDAVLLVGFWQPQLLFCKMTRHAN
ncbi:MAG: hypothetical protein HY078_12720 [Elusimicrobia bacterium]|nr:hypothetical protein [Elusimicrobiota bacterium]